MSQTNPLDDAPPVAGVSQQQSELQIQHSSNPYASRNRQRSSNIIEIDDAASSYAKSIIVDPEDKAHQAEIDNLREQCDIAQFTIGYVALGLSIGSFCSIGGLLKYGFRRYRNTLPTSMKSISPLRIARTIIHSNYVRGVGTSIGLGTVAHIAYLGNERTLWDINTWAVFAGVGGFCWGMLTNRHPIALASYALIPAMSGAVFGKVCQLTNNQPSIIPYVGRRRPPYADPERADRANLFWMYVLNRYEEEKFKEKHPEKKLEKKPH